MGRSILPKNRLRNIIHNAIIKKENKIVIKIKKINANQIKNLNALNIQYIYIYIYTNHSKKKRKRKIKIQLEWQDYKSTLQLRACATRKISIPSLHY